jgi:hypothetical protein
MLQVKLLNFYHTLSSTSSLSDFISMVQVSSGSYHTIGRTGNCLEAPLLYYPVQQGYALGDSQEYSKGFGRMTQNQQDSKFKIQTMNEKFTGYYQGQC